MRSLAFLALFALLLLLDSLAFGQAVVRTDFHLTAYPWKPLEIPASRYLEAIEGICRFSARQQNAEGAIIDPFLHREHQYATPYFAYAVGTLLAAGRAPDLVGNGVRAMEHATENFSGGRDRIPDNHGEFFIAALTEALELYAGRVPEATLSRWRERMRKPGREVIRGSLNNWETYFMKGEWLRAVAGLADRPGAVETIENAWKSRQREHFAPEPWYLYHDRSSDPDTLSVEAVGRGNLLALIQAGYDGPGAEQIRRAVESGTCLTLLLQDPSGQTPANGRTDDHVWVDAGYQLAFEVMGERMRDRDAWQAGQFRHAAMLGFQSIARWRRTDGEWAGSYYVTKNRFDPALRVGYQLASEYSNYNGSLMFHLSEAYHARRTRVEERPSPSEIGGYALTTDPEFSSVFANAGGMLMQANLRGDEAASNGNWWTPLGVVRFARPGWETRLGPSDGALTAEGGVTFAPEFFENGRWLRLAGLSSRYEGRWSVQFVHPLLVRCAIDYHPKAGFAGPTLRDDFTLTPDGVLSVVTKTSPGALPWAVTWPLIENDGRALERSRGDGIQSVRYPDGADQQNFIAIGDRPRMEEGIPMRSTYGDLRPIRVRATGPANVTFIYPRRAGEPEAGSVRDSLALTSDGFRSLLGKVKGTLYAGKTAAGGYGRGIDLNGDGISDVEFAKPCAFLLQLDGARVIAAETDRAVTGKLGGRTIEFKAHVPVLLDLVLDSAPVRE
jgi:hypothetical protein